MHFGFIATIPAIATLCFCPPDSLFGDWFLKAYIPTAFRLFSTRSHISSVGTPIFSGPNPTSSSTRVPTIWLSGFWNTIPAVCLTFKVFSSSLVSIPSTHTVPSVGITSAFKCFANVDLPEPL